jgi:hypothetical protein
MPALLLFILQHSAACIRPDHTACSPCVSQAAAQQRKAAAERRKANKAKSEVVQKVGRD